MAEKLTIQQAQAVENRGGKLLVSAAAGSGKTKVLVDRLLKYLTDPADPANLDDFLIITYTKAAASELRGKIAAKLTERIAQEPENRHLQKQIQRLFLTKISTVHGFCADVLREFTYRLDLAPDFRVADENECLQLRRNVLTDLLERSYEQFQGDPDFQAFVDTQGFGRDDRQLDSGGSQIQRYLLQFRVFFGHGNAAIHHLDVITQIPLQAIHQISAPDRLAGIFLILGIGILQAIGKPFLRI